MGSEGNLPSRALPLYLLEHPSSRGCEVTLAACNFPSAPSSSSLRSPLASVPHQEKNTVGPALNPFTSTKPEARCGPGPEKNAATCHMLLTPVLSWHSATCPAGSALSLHVGPTIRSPSKAVLSLWAMAPLGVTCQMSCLSHVYIGIHDSSRTTVRK